MSGSGGDGRQLVGGLGGWSVGWLGGWQVGWDLDGTGVAWLVVDMTM